MAEDNQDEKGNEIEPVVEETSTDQIIEGQVEDTPEADDSASPAVKEDVLADGTSEDKPVPYTRLKEEIDKRKEAESRISELEKREDHVEEDFFEELFGGKKKPEQVRTVPKEEPADSPFTQPQRQPQEQQPEVDPGQRPVTQSEMIQVLQYQQAQVEAETFKARAKEAIRDLAADRSISEDEAARLSFLTLREAWVNRGPRDGDPMQTIKDVKKTLDNVEKKILKRYIGAKKADSAKPKVDGPGGGTPSTAKTLETFGDVKASLTEKLARAMRGE